MTILSNPSVTVNKIGASVAAENAAQTILLVGQMTSAGTATADILYQDVSLTQIAAFAGAGSMMQDAYESLKQVNESTPIDCIFLDDPTGAPAVGTILWSGAATEAGSYEIGIGSSRNGVATVTVASGDGDDAVATAVTAAFAALTKCVCTVSTNATPEQNDITYNHDGTEGNFVPIYIKGVVGGLDYTLTGMASGTGVPTLTTTLDVIGEKRYQQIVQPGTYGVANLTTLLDARWNVTNKILDGVGIVCVADTSSNHTTALNLLNSESITYQCEDLETGASYKGPSIFENLFARSAWFAGLKALRLTDGSNITNYVNASGGANDAIGGAKIASLPYFNTPTPWPVMDQTFGFTDTQVEAIKTAGGWVAGNNTAGNTVVLGEVTTTYKTDAAAIADPSYKYLNNVEVHSQAAEYMFNNFKSDCAQSRLTSGDLYKNVNMHNEGSIRGLAVKYYNDLSGPEKLLFVAGEDARSFFLNNLTVVLDETTGTATLNMKVPIIVQLRTIIANLQIAFGTTG
jgi:hypothetical protein